MLNLHREKTSPKISENLPLSWHSESEKADPADFFISTDDQEERQYRHTYVYQKEYIAYQQTSKKERYGPTWIPVPQQKDDRRRKMRDGIIIVDHDRRQNHNANYNGSEKRSGIDRRSGKDRRK